ncbi:hypothetical protein QUA11_04070 [Microcoleus sp. S13_D1]
MHIGENLGENTLNWRSDFSQKMIAPHFQTLALSHDSYSTASNLLDRVDGWRQEATRKLQQSQRGEKGQFLTPSSVATLMAGMFEFNCPDISLLDAGAGIGSLLAAVVCEVALISLDNFLAYRQS